jgi:hypothetical protein
MLTYPANALAEQFEVDRSTMLRALRPVPPDLVKKGNRPTWTIANAAKALEQHRGKSGGGNHASGGIPAALQALYDQHERREEAMRALPTLDERREAARAMIPPLIEMDKASRQTGLANGQDRDLVHLRCDAMLHLHARGIEMATEWTHDEVWMMIVEADSDGDE